MDIFTKAQEAETKTREAGDAIGVALDAIAALSKVSNSVKVKELYDDLVKAEIETRRIVNALGAIRIRNRPRS